MRQKCTFLVTFNLEKFNQENTRSCHSQDCVINLKTYDIFPKHAHKVIVPRGTTIGKAIDKRVKLRDKLDISEIIDIFTCKDIISSHVRVWYRFYQFVTTRYATDFYIIKCVILL